MIKVLQLTNKSPYPPVEGGPMAMYAVTKGLLDTGFYVKVFSVSTKKFNVDIDDIDEEFIKKTSFESAFIDTAVKPLAALRNLFSNESYHLARFYSKTFEKHLIKIVSEVNFDVIIFETFYMSPYLKTLKEICPETKMVLRAHNIEHRIWERIAANERVPFKKAYIKFLAERLKRVESDMTSDFDAIIPITDVDAEWFMSKAPKLPCLILPFGINSIECLNKDAKPPPPLKLFHLGSMNWWPNIEAVNWLVEKFWPICKKKFPEVMLYLAGRNMPRRVLDLKNRKLIIEGEIDNSSNYVCSKHVLVAPIFSGSGIRIKILEAMAHGKTVITTSTGAEGIKYTHGKNIIIAEDLDGFVEAVNMILEEPEKVAEIGKNARNLINECYSPQTLANKLASFLKDQLLNLPPT